MTSRQLDIHPAGMTFVRALQIAVEIDERANPSDVESIREAVARLHGAGRSDSQLAAVIGCSAWTVRRNRIELGLPAESKGGRPPLPAHTTTQTRTTR